MYPDITGKLRAEVLEHCGPGGAPTYDNISHLKYCMCPKQALLYRSSSQTVHDSTSRA